MGNDHGAGPMAETAAQNDQICSTQLEIINEPVGRADRRLRNTRVDGVQPRNVMSARLEV
jgi:hypothetical protein